MRAGQRVIAIGNPLGFQKTVSDGLISGIRRTNDGVELIQTTVPISPGSSGGVLLNEYGLIIGITTSTFQGGQNINFAISLNSILNFIVDYGKADPQRTKFQQLRTAKESVWYRVILHWIGNIIGFLIALAFGSAFYWAIPLLMIAGYIVYGIGKGLWWLVSYPFRKAQERRQAHEYEAYLATLSAPHEDNSQEVTDEDTPDEEESDDFIFFCPKCGHRYELSSDLRGETLECVHCHKRITIPIE